MQDLQAPIVRVVVAEDRAFVRRQARLQLEAGPQRWHLAQVSPVLVDKSLAVSLTGAELICSQVRRRRAERLLPQFAAPAPPEAAEESAELDLIREEMRAADALYVELLVVIAEQSAWGHADLPQWEAQLREILDWKDQLEGRALELSAPPGEARPHQFEEIEPSVLGAELWLDLDCQQAGEVELCLEYCVPLAAWRPYHQAEFCQDQVQFRAEGCIWQNTGEDWTEVELVLSTERQSLGALPPPVPLEYLSTRKRRGEIVLQQRDVQVQELSPRLANHVPGIDDGGQVFTTPVAGRCTVPCDGLAVRVPLFDFQVASRMEHLLAAEICPQVVQLTRLTNEAAWPLLAGPVDLVREGGWVGRSRLGLVAPGESFSLGWGPQPDLRVLRAEGEGPWEKDDLLGGWKRQRTCTTLTLSNLSSRTHAVEVVERLPVSEIKQVEIVAESEPDENGFLRWNVELGPRSKTVIQAAYWTRRRKEVVTA
ncbi:MAG: mucoidy inhibitor MuiA family protein [Candidatus Eremiobacteraeota bacterium]|nr:mucoidy inhibitor MuiA family protein [Candidatus Eremiobacteraeota bacterium]